LQILSVNVFQKVPFNQLLTDYATTDHDMLFYNQLTFNDL